MLHPCSLARLYSFNALLHFERDRRGEVGIGIEMLKSLEDCVMSSVQMLYSFTVSGIRLANATHSPY